MLLAGCLRPCFSISVIGSPAMACLHDKAIHIPPCTQTEVLRLSGRLTIANPLVKWVAIIHFCFLSFPSNCVFLLILLSHLAWGSYSLDCWLSSSCWGLDPAQFWCGSHTSRWFGDNGLRMNSAPNVPLWDCSHTCGSTPKGSWIGKGHSCILRVIPPGTLLELSLLFLFFLHLEGRCGVCILEGRCAPWACARQEATLGANAVWPHCSLSMFQCEESWFVSAEWPHFLLCCRSDDHEEASVLPLLHAGFNRVCTRCPASLSGAGTLTPDSPITGRQSRHGELLRKWSPRTVGERKRLCSHGRVTSSCQSSSLPFLLSGFSPYILAIDIQWHKNPSYYIRLKFCRPKVILFKSVQSIRFNVCVIIYRYIHQIGTQDSVHQGWPEFIP